MTSFSASVSSASDYGVATTTAGCGRARRSSASPCAEDPAATRSTSPESAAGTLPLPAPDHAAFLPVKHSDFPIEFTTLAHEAFEQWCFTNSNRAAKRPSATLGHVRLVASVTAEEIESGLWWCPIEEWCGTETVTVFHSSRLPNIALSLLGRVALQHCIGKGPDHEMQVAALVLARRYCSAKGILLTAHAMHRLYAACLYVAVAAHLDFSVRFRKFAHAAGLEAQEMSRLVVEVLQGLDWHAQVTSDDILALPLTSV